MFRDALATTIALTRPDKIGIVTPCSATARGRPGRNFTSAPTISFSGSGGTGAAATAALGTWGWGGGMDQGGYLSEEILSTTLFRVYRSLGGDSTDLGRRTFAARATAYLILRAVATLSPVSNPANPAAFLTALRTADAADWTSEGLAGGAYNKVLTWAFEKQNLNGGARPVVDVYIDDGRGGEYQHQPVHWANGSLWNRRSADGIQAHQEAALGVTNYAYCKVKNRGTSTATGVVVRGYHCLPSAGVVWPNNGHRLDQRRDNRGQRRRGAGRRPVQLDAQRQCVGP